MTERIRLVPDDFMSAPYRVRGGRVCPVCGHDTWCLSDLETWAICKRTKSQEEWGEAGFLHRLNGGTGHAPSSTVAPVLHENTPTPAERAQRKRTASLWASLEEAVAAYDSDKAGEKANEATAHALEEAGSSPDQIRIVQWPPGAKSGMDLNDILKSGPPGLGKSRLTLQGAIEAIRGRPWLGLETHCPDATWLLFQTENSARRLRHNLGGVRRHRADCWRNGVEECRLEACTTMGPRGLTIPGQRR